MAELKFKKKNWKIEEIKIKKKETGGVVSWRLIGIDFVVFRHSSLPSSSDPRRSSRVCNECQNI